MQNLIRQKVQIIFSFLALDKKKKKRLINNVTN